MQTLKVIFHFVLPALRWLIDNGGNFFFSHYTRVHAESTSFICGRVHFPMVFSSRYLALLLALLCRNYRLPSNVDIQSRLLKMKSRLLARTNLVNDDIPLSWEPTSFCESLWSLNPSIIEYLIKLAKENEADSFSDQDHVISIYHSSGHKHEPIFYQSTRTEALVGNEP